MNGFLFNFGAFLAAVLIVLLIELTLKTILMHAEDDTAQDKFASAL